MAVGRTELDIAGRAGPAIVAGHLFSALRHPASQYPPLVTTLSQVAFHALAHSLHAQSVPVARLGTPLVLARGSREPGVAVAHSFETLPVIIAVVQTLLLGTGRSFPALETDDSIILDESVLDEPLFATESPISLAALAHRRLETLAVGTACIGTVDDLAGLSRVPVETETFPLFGALALLVAVVQTGLDVAAIALPPLVALGSLVRQHFPVNHVPLFAVLALVAFVAVTDSEVTATPVEALVRTVLDFTVVSRPAAVTDAGAVVALAVVAAGLDALLHLATLALPAVVTNHLAFVQLPVQQVPHRTVVPPVSHVAPADALVTLPVVGTAVGTGGNVAR